jgi:hypothetical protein
MEYQAKRREQTRADAFLLDQLAPYPGRVVAVELADEEAQLAS